MGFGLGFSLQMPALKCIVYVRRNGRGARGIAAARTKPEAGR